MKDRLIRETINLLTQYFAVNANCISLPEMMVPVGFQLRKFRKHSKNSNYRQTVQTLIDLLEKNAKVVMEERQRLKDKSLRDPAKLTQTFTHLLKLEQLPLVKEAEKLN
jgi:hypothetical protein